MRSFFDRRQLLHAPASEFHNGALVPHAETPGRARSILAAIGDTVVPMCAGETLTWRVQA